MSEVKVPKYIGDEVARQICDLKQQLRKEISDELSLLKERIIADIMLEIANKDIVTAAVPARGSELARIDNNMMLMIGEQVQQQVYDRVIDEINEKVVPKINNMVEWVNYSMQDGGEVVDKYRRAVEYQTNKIDPNTKLLTSGKNDKRIISAHVRTFFEDDSDSE